MVMQRTANPLKSVQFRSRPLKKIFAENVLRWYDQNQRSFPWRISPNDHETAPSPYRTWISEMMLQQTGASTVVPYFHRFIQTFPTLNDLAQASIDQVLVLWQGLGYYRRAHHLHRAAKIMAHQGIPQSYDGWLALPGIGPYTAAAITAIAQNQRAVAVDGNIRRVFSRYFGMDGPDWVSHVWKKADEQLADTRWGDYTQALMDLGASVCKTKNPACTQCPLVDQCHAFSTGTPTKWPTKIVKSQKKKQFGHVYVVFDDQTEHVFMHATPEGGLLGGLWRFPGSSWELQPPPDPTGYDFSGTLVHLFTHITLHLKVWVDWGARGKKNGSLDDEYTNPSDTSMLLSDEYKNPLNDSGILLPHPFKTMHSDAPPKELPHTSQPKETPPVGVPQPTPSQDHDHILGRWIPLNRVHEYPLSRLMQNVLNQARSSVSSGTIAMAPRHTEWV
jgi:A/G-specific adenine glycosylase